MAARYTIAKAAEELGISISQVNNLLKSGAIIAHTDTDNPKSYRYISKHQIDEYIRAREEAGIRGQRMVG